MTVQPLTICHLNLTLTMPFRLAVINCEHMGTKQKTLTTRHKIYISMITTTKMGQTRGNQIRVVIDHVTDVLTVGLT